MASTGNDCTGAADSKLHSERLQSIIVHEQETETRLVSTFKLSDDILFVIFHIQAVIPTSGKLKI